MEPFHPVSSEGIFLNQEGLTTQLSPRKDVVVLYSNSYVEDVQIKENGVPIPCRKIIKSPRDMSPCSRPRSNDIYEQPEISVNHSSSNSESVSGSSSSEHSIEKVVSSMEKLHVTSPESKPARKRSYVGQKRLDESKAKLNTIKSARSQLDGKPKEEIVKFYDTEIKDNITPVNVSSNQTDVDELKKYRLPEDADEISERSYKIGEAILQTKNGETVKNDIEKFIKMGITNRRGCSEDMWRCIERIKVYDSTSSQPIIDGTLINDVNEKERHKNISICMGKMYNLLFQHVTSSKDELLSANEFGSTQKDAGNIGDSLGSRLKEKGKNQAVLKIMQRILALSKQELFTRPATWAIPKAFRTVGGNDALEVTEFGLTLEEKMKPLQYNREISIILKENGCLDYAVEQPITLKDRISNSPLGTCRILTTVSFDKDMLCVSVSQKVKRAALLKDAL